MNQHPAISWDEALTRIEARAGDFDERGEWPAESIDDLAACGAMGWAVASADGGAGMEAVALHERYEALCGACMTTGLVFTQRDAAVGLLAGAERTPMVRRLLREMAAGETFATIGISQLTTSRQHLPPSVTAEAVGGMGAGGGYILRGAVPWVTSLHHNGRVIVGAVVPGGLQILAALDAGAPGVEPGPATQLAALTGSDTGEIRLRDVAISAADVIAGPCENALAGRAATRGFALTTCVLPLGVAGGAIRQATSLAAGRSAAAGEAVARLARQHGALHTRVYAVAAAGGEAVQNQGAALRAAANVLANRAALAALELAKGHGFLAGEAAQRRAREALFFYVWSSPPAVIEQTLDALAGPRGDGA